MKNYQYRHIARVVIEAATPLCVGSGQKDIATDAAVAKDVNGLPYIPGTSIAGVVRHALEDNGLNLDMFFGNQKQGSERGSEIIFSEARMIGVAGKAVDGLQTIDFSNDFYRHYDSLPVRQHVRIGHKGAAEAHGKFDEQVVLKGTRFCFEIEAVSETDEDSTFCEVLRTLHNAEFRIGSGSRKGFGKIVVKEFKKKTLNLACESDLQWYLNHSSSLAEALEGEKVDGEPQCGSTVYTLTLMPEDFFLFGAGFGDNEADLVPVKEKKVCWKPAGGVEIPEVKDNMLLIPASSIKGALAHRVAFHHNKQHQRWADELNDTQVNAFTTENEAVVALFGSADTKNPRRGIVLFEDIIEEGLNEKIFPHVQIDRFTGGAIDGALFQEKASYGCGSTFITHITLLNGADEDSVQALEAALQDICKGLLPLGGGTTKGYGCFKGKLEKNNQIIINKL